MRLFTAVIERCSDTGLYVGYVPGFPGAHSQGTTLDELHDNLREVIAIQGFVEAFTMMAIACPSPRNSSKISFFSVNGYMKKKVNKDRMRENSGCGRADRLNFRRVNTPARQRLT